MKIALISDIHGNLPALESVIKDIQTRGVDLIVNLGDTLSGPLFPLETAQYLMSMDCVNISGNHERQLLTLPIEKMGASDAFTYAQLGENELAWIKSHPASLELTDEVYLCHGSPRRDTEYFLETVSESGIRVASASEVAERLGNIASPVVACGHTHLPRVVKTTKGQMIVNPGSVGLPAYDDKYPFSHNVETGSPDARYAILEKKNESWLSMQISVPYNFKSVVELAKKRNRMDWAIAMETGYMT